MNLENGYNADEFLPTQKFGRWKIGNCKYCYYSMADKNRHE